MRKFLAILLSLMMVGAVASAEAVTDYKIVIITGSLEQHPEEFRAAEALQSQYPDVVLTTLYADDYQDNPEDIGQKIDTFALDPDVKAIIVCQAIPGTAEAFDAVSASRDDVLLVAGAPHEEVATIAEAADLVVDINALSAGVQAVETSIQWGAEAFVQYASDSDRQKDVVAGRQELMSASAMAVGLEFLDRAVEDMQDDEMAAFMKDDVKAVLAAHEGKKVAFFAADESMQAALLAAVLENENALYPLAANPSPYAGYPEALGIDIQEDTFDDAGAMLSKIAAAFGENNAAERFATWALPVNKLFIDACYDYATRYIQGEFEEANSSEQLYQSMLAASGLETLELTNYVDMQGTEHGNYYVLLLPAVELSAYVK